MKKLVFGVAALGLLAPAAPAFADPPSWAPAHGRRAKEREVEYRPRVMRRDDRIWWGDDGRYRCKRSDGTTGLIIGAGVGALLGRSLDGGRDKTTGTVLGAAGGALLGRAIDRGEVHCK